MQGDEMPRPLYVLCVCLFSMAVICEIKNNVPQKETAEAVSMEPADSMECTNSTKSKKSTDSMECTNSGKQKIAYLTFDDGPSEITPQILDTLKEKGAKATFFLIGSEISAEREEIVKREIKEGHSVGIHTYSHEKNKIYGSEESFFEDFNLCRARVHEVTGVSPVLYRFPWGSNNAYVTPFVDSVMEKLEKENIRSFDWNVSGEDSVGNGVSKATIYHNVAKDLEKYDQPVILLHDSNTMKNTAAVLGEILDLIVEKGYSFDTLENRETYTFPKSWR